MIDFSPLWPPELPRCRSRIAPNGSAKSSLTTINAFLKPPLPSSLEIKQPTASPLKFIYVCGFANLTRWSSITALPTSDWQSRRFTLTPASAANLSTSMNPRLCRVCAYSSPGFPSPTIKYIANSQLPIADRICRSNKHSTGPQNQSTIDNPHSALRQLSSARSPSPSPSSSSFLPLPITSGSTGTSATGSSFTMPTVAITVSGSSRISTPSPTGMSETCSTSCTPKFVTSTSRCSVMSRGSQRTSTSRMICSSTP